MGEALKLLSAKRKVMLKDITDTDNMLRANAKYSVRLSEHLLKAEKSLKAINDEIIAHQTKKEVSG